MLQISVIKERKEAIIEAMKKRNFDASELINKAIELDDLRKKTQTQNDALLAEMNKLSKDIGQLFKSGEGEKAGLLKQKTVQIKEEIKVLSNQLDSAKNDLQEVLYQIPNIPNDLVPFGKDDTDNEKIYEHGTIPELGENALPHWELAKKYDIIDFELGTKITGAGFPVYKGKGAKLQRAIINYFLDKNEDAGYEEMQVPHLINEASGIGTGQLPDKEGYALYINWTNKAITVHKYRERKFLSGTCKKTTYWETNNGIWIVGFENCDDLKNFIEKITSFVKEHFNSKYSLNYHRSCGSYNDCVKKSK